MEMAGSSYALDVSTPTHDFEYMMASNVNVSNFVSVKLSGHNNYRIWKAQMLCLIKSQVLLHIIDAEHPFPVDKGVHKIGQYNELVKGWIFGSVNEKVLKDLVDLVTAQEAWMKLESLFNRPVSDTEGVSSNAPDVFALDAIAPVVSAMREDLKYIQALNVDVSNFMSEKLEGHINYYTWKIDMLYLIGSHGLLDIIHAEARFPWNKDDPMTQKYDSLVRGWILGTMNEEKRHEYGMYRSVQLMWRKLESTFTYQHKTNNSYKRYTKDDSSNKIEDLKYKEASNVNVSDFVYVKLSFPSNYNIWRAQMLSLLESHDLLHYVLDRVPGKKINDLVKGWIFSTMDDKRHKDFYVNLSTSSLWKELESVFGYYQSRPEPIDSASTQDLKYTQALNVDVSNFVSVKLSGRSNYEIWKAQMLCLTEIQELDHVLDNSTGDKYDKLVKGWILSTTNEQLLSTRDFTGIKDNSAKVLWEELQSDFGRKDPQSTFGIEFINNDTKFVSDLPESDTTDKKRLYKVVAEGWWKKAKSILKIHKNAAQETTLLHVAVETESSVTEAVRDTLDIEAESSRTDVVRDNPDIETESPSTESVKKELYKATAEGRWRKAKLILRNSEIAATDAIALNGNTILHIAVEMGHNYFVEKVLEFLKKGEDIEMTNKMGRTALHIAAMVGNTHAARLLVQKRKELLGIRDENNDLPLNLASKNKNLDIYAYLFKSSTHSNSDDGSFQIHRDAAILDAIFSKQYDVAEKLLETLKSSDYRLGQDILMAMTITFPTDLGFKETLIYPSFHNVCQKIVGRGSLLFHPDRCVDDILLVVNTWKNTCCNWLGKNSGILLVLTATLYPIYQLICLLILMLILSFSMLYLLLWKVLVVTVHPIKLIEKKKKEYKKAKTILRMVCKKMGQSHPKLYSESLFEAVRLDLYEVVDEILFTSPSTIDCMDEDGYNIIQSSILNRAEKVFNLIYHIIERTKSHIELFDSSNDNLGHLAGRLAPSFVLGRTTGAALQLQREILWFEEVKKLVLPLQLTEKNIYKETPAMVFTREHQNLLSQGEIWMKTTAESCSITAALIVTVVFAAAITVPGGNNQESGIPLFQKETSFTIFAVSNAFSLFTSVIALLLFLSILTARSSEKDFLVSLPRRLIFGIVALFFSTTALMVAFGAILFLVFCDQRPWMLAPICAFTCMSICVMVAIKLPLLVDLIRSTYFPIFGKQRYIESCKVNRKNTIFTK